ncbi:flippase [Natronorubrum aibiense]|uniref:flippase n=1 Tax=Natronorubrum aibiense TaxID=348826 RepID=UPI0013873C84|nr:flippase [Natronorubrum aibiense]
MSSDKSSLRVVTNGAVIFFLGKGVSNATQFLLQLLLTRTVGAASFGVYSYAMTILSVVGVFARLGVTESIMRFVPEFEDDKKAQGRYVTIAFCTSIVGSLLASLILFHQADNISAYTLDNPVFADVLRIFAILLPFQVLTQAIYNTFRAFEDAKYQIFIRDVLVPILNILSIGIALFLGATIIGASAAVAFAGLLAAVISLVLLAQKINIDINVNTDRNEIYTYYNFSVPLTLTAAGSLLYTNVDRLMVGYFLGDVEVGIYAISIGLATATGLALTGINQLFPPIASKLHTQGERKELNNVFQTVTRWSFTICLLPAVLLYVYRFEVLALFGPEFTAGSLVLSLFVVAQVTRSAVGPSGYMLMMSGHQYVVLFNRWFLGVSNVVANYILIIRYGFIGAAIASALTLAVVNLFRLIEIWLLEGYNPYTPKVIKPIAAGLVAYSLSMLVRTGLSSNGLSGIVLIIFGCVIGAIVYTAIIFSLGIDNKDRKIYNELKG